MARDPYANDRTTWENPYRPRRSPDEPPPGGGWNTPGVARAGGLMRTHDEQPADRGVGRLEGMYRPHQRPDMGGMRAPRMPQTPQSEARGMVPSVAGPRMTNRTPRTPGMIGPNRMSPEGQMEMLDERLRNAVTGPGARLSNAPPGDFPGNDMPMGRVTPDPEGVTVDRVRDWARRRAPPPRPDMGPEATIAHAAERPVSPMSRPAIAASPPIAPAQGVGEGEAIPGVSGRLQGLLADDSSYIQQARTRALQEANRRGLANSSIAVGAGEAAAIDAALPIALSDAQIAQQGRTLRTQELMQAREHGSQQLIQRREHDIQRLMQEEGLSHEAAQNLAERNLRRNMQWSEHEAQRLMQEFGLNHEAAQNQAERNLRRNMQRSEHETQKLMQRFGLSHEAAENQAERDLRKNLAHEEQRVQQFMQRQGLDHEAAQNLAARELQDALSKRNIEAQRLMQEEGLTHDAAMQAADRTMRQNLQTQLIMSNERVAAAQRELQDLISQRNVRSQELMQQRGIAHDEAMQAADRELQSKLAAAERRLRSSIASAQRASEAAARRSAERIAQQQAVSRIGTDLNTSINVITNNPDIPSDERQTLMSEAKERYDQSLSLAQQIGGTQMSWTPAA